MSCNEYKRLQHREGASFFQVLTFLFLVALVTCLLEPESATVTGMVAAGAALSAWRAHYHSMLS